MIILILSLSFSYLFIGGVFMLSFNAFFQNKEYERFQSIIINYLSANIPLIVLFIFSIILTHILLNTSVIAMVRDKKYEINMKISITHIFPPLSLFQIRKSHFNTFITLRVSGSCTPHICGNVLPRAGRGTGTPGGWGCPGKTPAPRQSPGFCRRAHRGPRRYRAEGRDSPF